MSEETKNEATIEKVAENESEINQQLVHDLNEPVTSIKQLLEFGCHFGHQARKRNPKMAKYIYSTTKNGFNIINLEKTIDCINNAYDFIKNIVSNSSETNNKVKGKVLFVGTKKQCQESIKSEATRCGSFYVNKRWLGGTLTNFKTISKRIKYYNDLLEQKNNKVFESLTKVEAGKKIKELQKLEANLEGLKDMLTLPSVLVVADPIKEKNAIAEAHKLGIPVIAICDTNCDPDMVEFPIPANDDTQRSLALLLCLLADAVAEAKNAPVSIAHVKEDKVVTMKEVVATTEKQNREKLEKIRRERKERENREEAFRKNRNNAFHERIVNNVKENAAKVAANIENKETTGEKK